MTNDCITANTLTISRDCFWELNPYSSPLNMAQYVHYSAPHCKRCTSYSNSVPLSVRLSVRPSHAGIVPK